MPRTTRCEVMPCEWLLANTGAATRPPALRRRCICANCCAVMLMRRILPNERSLQRKLLRAPNPRPMVAPRCSNRHPADSAIGNRMAHRRRFGVKNQGGLDAEDEFNREIDLPPKLIPD